MSVTLPKPDPVQLLPRAERMAKADLRKTEQPNLGRAIERAVRLRGWTLKEFAAAMDRDPRQCARWMDGTERAQFDVMFSVESFRQPLLVALAEMVGDGVEVETHISIRRRA